MARLHTAAFNRAIRGKDFGKARLILNDWEGSLDEVDWDDATKEGTKMTALSCAAEAGSMELVNELLEIGAKVNADVFGPGDGEGPMVKAAKNGHIDVVGLLLSRGVNADLAFDSPALEWVAKGLESMYDRATRARGYDMVRLLVSHGAKVDNSRGFELLAKASAQGHLGIVKLMVEKGANLDDDDKYAGYTPLSSAARSGHLEIVKFLAEEGANLDGHKYVYVKPLSSAAEYGHFQIVQFLVEKGADPNGHKHEYGTPLSSAAKSGHLEIIKFLIRRGADPNHSSAYGSALSFASQSGHLDVVKLLIEEGANPDASNNHEQTPLSLAAKYGHPEVVKFLAGLGASSDIPDKSGQTPLSLAAKYGHPEVVKFLAGLGASSDRPDKSGQTPLSLAAKSGHLEVVKFLAGLGASSDRPDNSGVTPLSLAIKRGHFEVVEFLAENGADPNLIDLSGQTALSVAVGNGNFEIVEFLVQHRADPNLQVAFEKTPLYIAAESGHAQIAKLLIQHNANPDAICSVERMPWNFISSADYNEFAQLLLDQIRGPVTGGTTHPPDVALIHKYKDIAECMHNGITPSSDHNIHSWLLWAARYGQSAVVEIAINADVQLDICNTHGQTPLSFAAKYGHLDITRSLLDKQAHVNSMCTSGENWGRTPLSFAAEGGFLGIIKLLLREGADPSIKSSGKNRTGQNPLSIAAARGHWEVVRELLQATSPGIDVADAEGRTPLWWAASCGHAITVERILHRGVLVDQQDKQGVTALSISAGNGHDEVVRQLIDRSNLSIKDNEGRTALWRALLNGHTKVAKILIKKDDITLHCLVKANDLTSARVLLENGYDVERVNSEGLTALRLALCLRNPDFAGLLLKHSASSRDISVMEWVDTFAGDHSGILQMSVLQDGSGQLRLLQDNSSTTRTNVKKTIIVYRDETLWASAPLQLPSLPLEPYKMQINIDQGSDKWIMLQFPTDEGQKHFGFPEMPRLVIGWRVPLPAKAGETMQPELFLSSLQYLWIPEDGIDFFQQFIQSLRDRWMELCGLVDQRFTQSRADQLQAEGRSPEMMRRLAKDAQRLANLRLAFRGHLKTSRDYISAKGANSRHSDSARELLLHLESRVGDRLSDLESTIKELLQIEFAWAAITESRISTNLGQNVMLLTYVSIFYLPLAFCAALWAIPNLSERATLNSFIITSVVVGVATLLIAFNLENIASLFRGKYSQWREKVVEDMHQDVRWETRADELQNSLHTRSSPSEWLLVIFLLSQLIRKLKGERNTQKGQPQCV